MAEEHPEFDTIDYKCEAFPGLTFSLWGNTDSLLLNARQDGAHENDEKKVMTLLSINRATAAIKRHLIPADFLHLPGRLNGLIPNEEELDRMPRVSPSSGDLSTSVSGRGCFDGLNFRLRATGNRPQYIALEVCYELYWQTIAMLNSADRHLVLCELDTNIPGLRLNRGTIHVGNVQNVAQPVRDERSGLALMAERAYNGISLYVEHPRLVPDPNTPQQRENRMRIGTLARGTLYLDILNAQRAHSVGLTINPLGTLNTQFVSNAANFCYLTEWEHLPDEAGAFSPMAGHWTMKVLKDGRRKYKWLRGLRPEFRPPYPPIPCGSTSFILPAIAPSIEVGPNTERASIPIFYGEAPVQEAAVVSEAVVARTFSAPAYMSWHEVIHERIIDEDETDAQ